MTGLDADLLTVLPALSRHPSLKHLHLGKNFNIKNRVLDEVLQKLVQLIQEEECALQSLSLIDSRLRSRGTVLVNALGSNTCLKKVDLSGNNMDDIGAKMLSKALQINTTLRSVTWDRNNTSAAGFLDVARALEHNFILQYMPLPLSDISQAYRSAPERTEQALTKIQRSLVRNNQTQRFSQRQALRLHRAWSPALPNRYHSLLLPYVYECFIYDCALNTPPPVMERLCVRVQQQVCVLRGTGEMEEIQAAKQVLKEARNSRALYPSLCELAHVLSVDGPVRQKLDSLAGELAKAAEKELQAKSSTIIRLRARVHPSLCHPDSSDGEGGAGHPPSLRNRQMSHFKRWDGTCEDGTGWRFNRNRDSLDITDEEFSTSIDTIAIKKRSSRTRRIRPVSTRLSLCDDSSSSPPPSVPSYSSPLSRSASWEGLSELPTQGLPLHHVTRVRPRPPRRHKGGHIPADTHSSENGGISPLDDGLPDFYTKRVLPDSQLSSLHKAHSLRRKKRRNMLAIFGFRKNRNQTLSNQEPESEAEVYSDGCHFVATAPTGFVTATENVYTLLQPPRSSARAGSPGEGADGKTNDHQGENTLVLSPPPVPGIPHPGMGGSKHRFFSPREVQKKSEVDAVFEHPSESDRYWMDDKQRAGDTLHPDKPWIEARQGDQPAEKHAERQRFDSRPQDRTPGEPRTIERQPDRYWTESRHLDRQWTVDRHTQRQIDRKIERQWMGGRQIDRLWSENRPTDLQVDNQGTESRQGSKKTERQVQTLILAQRPLPPYPSDRTPSPKQDKDPLKSAEAAAPDWHQQDTQDRDRQMCPDAGGGFTEGWRSSGGGGGRAASFLSKPDPPPQSSKPLLSKLRTRHRLESADTLPEEEGEVEEHGKTEKNEREKRRDSEGHPPPIPEKPKTSSYVTFPKESANERNLPPPPVPPPTNKPLHGLPDRAASQGEEGLRPQAPVKPQRNRKAMSCDAGTVWLFSITLQSNRLLRCIIFKLRVYVYLCVKRLYLTVHLCVFLSSLNSGTDRESPNSVEKLPNRKAPVKKPRLPQNRNKSLDIRLRLSLYSQRALVIPGKIHPPLSGQSVVMTTMEHLIQRGNKETTRRGGGPGRKCVTDIIKHQPLLKHSDCVLVFLSH
ncbi:hypothetical protein F7725_027664 [Dissostichus mawsoni]|uniref:CARMIL C-terminal domain-containing protein n=1 Tax=Dissostichus mawsoni TaxID=36200 RepID=A0A7J5XDI9_DISMA|nr:hypothetical protein F7725_027664 [Dissostichus mawsoni]